jgi:hypothetical protein
MLKPLKEIQLEKLPKSKPLDVFTLYESVRRGVKNAVKPWMLDMPPETSDTQLQGVYNETVKEYTDAIMTILINELFIS